MPQQRLLLTDHQHPAGLSHLPAPAAQPADGSARRGARGSAGEGALQQGTGLGQGHRGSLEGSAAEGPGALSGSGGSAEGKGVSVEAGARSAALGVPAVPAPSRGSLSPASRRRRPGTSAGTAGAAGPRGRPRRCRRPGRWRAGPGRTGGGTTASRRRVGRGRRRREALAAPLRLGSGVGDLLAARRLYKPFS